MKRCLVLIFLCGRILSAHAEIPQLIGYQGSLAGSSGVPVDTVVNMTFQLYSDSLAGVPVWTEAQPGVVVDGGLFTVQLGRYSGLNDTTLDYPGLWLGIQVGGDSEMSPRVRLTSVAYSYRTGSIDGASGGVVIGDVIINGRLNAGSGNTNSGTHAHVLGQNNTASGLHSTVAGGAGNQASNVGTVVGGGDANVASGTNATLGGGDSNTASGDWSVVSGGYENTASALYASVAGGQGNLSAAEGAAIGGGTGNVSGATHSLVGGGSANQATGDFATVGGGQFNRARGDYSVVGGGGAAGLADSNYAGETGATVAGGIGNHAVQEHATVSGGLRNRAAELGAVVGGGINNLAGNGATVAGGDSNTAAGIIAFVGGGRYNVASDFAATTSGGYQNQATFSYATISGGSTNTASGSTSAIGGGQANIAAGLMSTVSGGRYGRARGAYSAVVGGGGASQADSNSARGDASTVLGGRRNETTALFGLAAGYRAKALHVGSFVWADSTAADFASTAADQFNVRAAGGTRIFTNSSATLGAQLITNATAWTSLSDSTTKTDIVRVNTRDVLERLLQLPISEWRYKAQPDTRVRHMGPMAQDFWAQFQLGEDSLGISTLDPDGVALAAIQELAKQNRALQDRVDSDRQELQRLRARLDELAPEPLGAILK